MHVCREFLVDFIIARVFISRDKCAYTKEGNADPNELFCFKTEGGMHDVECEVCIDEIKSNSYLRNHSG